MTSDFNEQGGDGPEGQMGAGEESTTQSSDMQPMMGGDGIRGGGPPIVGQLQNMIDNLAQVATPVLREVAAKAAELAAKAGEAAGPIAHKAADVTGDVGHRVAVKGREMAADLRRPSDEQPSGGEDIPPGPDSDSGGVGA